MSSLLQISDPHFGTERPAVVEALVQLTRQEKPRGVLLSGDITQRATPRQFAAARDFVDRLGVARVIVVPGNHDIPLFNLPLRVFAPYARYKRAFGPTLEPVYDDEDWFVMSLNTTRPWRHQDGELSYRQIDRVAARMRLAASTKLRLVMVHQPIGVPRADERHNLLRRHEAAVRDWSQAGVDMVLGGHIHLPFVLPLHEHQTDLPQPIWAVQAGTAVSDRVRHDAGNSVNLLRAQRLPDGRRGCIVERWDYVDERQGFQSAARHRLAFGEVSNPQPVMEPA